MPPIIFSFIQQTCQILGIKRKLRFSSDLQRVHCLVSESLHQFLLWPNLTVLCCPLCPCPQGSRSSFVPGSSQALFTDPPPPPPHLQSLPLFASGFNSSIKLIYSSCQEEDKFSSQPVMRKAVVQMNNC